MPGSAKREHQTGRLQAIRLRYCINTHLDEQGLTAPDIAQMVGLPAAEAVRLLSRRQWREGDVAALPGGRQPAWAASFAGGPRSVGQHGEDILSSVPAHTQGRAGNTRALGYMLGFLVPT